MNPWKQKEIIDISLSAADRNGFCVMMLGDCSTQGDEGREFLNSDKPLTCPFWRDRGEMTNCSSLCHKSEPCWMTKDGVCSVTQKRRQDNGLE